MQTIIARCLAILGAVACASDTPEPWTCTASKVQHHTSYSTWAKVHHYHPAHDDTVCMQLTHVPIPDTVVHVDHHAHYTRSREAQP